MLTKKKKTKEKEIQKKVGDPFLIQDDRSIDGVSFSLSLLQNPEISYSLSAVNKSIYGSYEIELMGDIVKGPKKLINNQAKVNINRFGSKAVKENEQSSILGYMGVWEYETYFEIEITLNINNNYACDILKFLNDYKPSNECVPHITIKIKNERRYNEWPVGHALKDNTRKIMYDVIDVSFWYICEEVI